MRLQPIILDSFLSLQLLGLSIAIMTVITYYEKRLIVISEVSLETNPIRTFHSLGKCWKLWKIIKPE